MALDPLVKAFLDQAAAIPRPKAWEMPLGAMRKSFAGMMGLVGPKDPWSGKSENFKIPAPQGDIRARAYAPIAVGAAAMPALVYFHGGGFVVGDLDTHDGLCRLLARRAASGDCGGNIAWRPSNKRPAPLDDAAVALHWIFGECFRLWASMRAELPEAAIRRAVTLTACLTHAVKKRKGMVTAFQLLLFPATDLAGHFASMDKFGVGYFLDRQTIEWNNKQVIPEDADRTSPKISPLRAKDFAGLPPAYIMLGGYDPSTTKGWPM